MPRADAGSRGRGDDESSPIIHTCVPGRARFDHGILWTGQCGVLLFDRHGDVRESSLLPAVAQRWTREGSVVCERACPARRIRHALVVTGSIVARLAFWKTCHSLRRCGHGASLRANEVLEPHRSSDTRTIPIAPIRFSLMSGRCRTDLPPRRRPLHRADTL